MGKRLDTDGQAQAILYAAVYGDEAACTRFKLSARTLRRYRDLARDKGSDLSQTVRSYAKALQPDGKALDFAATLDAEVADLISLFKGKAVEASAKNPESNRALGELISTLLEHRTALAFIGTLAPPGEADG